MPKWNVGEHAGYGRDRERVAFHVSYQSAGEVLEAVESACEELSERGRVHGQTHNGVSEKLLWDWGHQAVYQFHWTDSEPRQVILLHLAITNGQQLELERARQEAIRRLRDIKGVA